MTDNIEFAEAGDFSVDAEARTVRGLLLPWGEKSRISANGVAPIAFERGTVPVPKDPSVVSVNRHHNRYDPVGRADEIQDTERGLVATFSIAKTDEGDEFLSQHNSGVLRKLSAELTFDRDEADQSKAKRGRLTGAGFVTEGAFASAALFALGDVEEQTTQEQPVEREVPDGAEKPLGLQDGATTFSTATDESGVTTSTTKTVGDPETDEAGTTTQKTTTTDVVVTPTTPNPEEATVADATVPSTLNASAPADKVTKENFLAAVSGAARTGDPGMLAALSDVKISGTGAVGTGVVVPEYVGEVWSGRAYQRKVIPLLNQGSLTSLTTQGWRFTQAPEVSEWAGNKSDVPSNAPKTEPVNWDMQRFAGGWDIAREFIDFGETAVLDSFLRLAADSYAKKSDNWMLGKLLAGATVAGVGTGVPEGVGDGFAKIIRGALRVIASDATPSYALIAPDLYEEFMFTKKDDTLAFLTTTIGLEEGALESFKIVPHAGVDAGEVLVGAKEAAGAYELAGSPIRINALDIARGGVDEALFGYIQARIEYPAGLQLVTDNA
ncbi:hypothetical protein [Curtobacterium sp. MCBA15_008]|uniref:hypothetical protein n=1 Tax=Curtobacterium sp. MCBA15_008 TaxID=1898736 RepID=UPI0008DE80E1|nr:hypothetical protein [Curtobacterium sp. MCBA15_008]OII04310.1 hypothetical protein BIU96_07880 [Curtobacterium sp. MCBA15_008]